MIRLLAWAIRPLHDVVLVPVQSLAGHLEARYHPYYCCALFRR